MRRFASDTARSSQKPPKRLTRRSSVTTLLKEEEPKQTTRLTRRSSVTALFSEKPETKAVSFKIRRSIVIPSSTKKDGPDLMEDLRQTYDPEGQGKRNQPKLYSNVSLLKRESIKFSPQVLGILAELWDVIDSDESGEIDKIEYSQFHGKLTLSLVPGAAREERSAMLESDWKSDSGDSQYIKRAGFYSSMFELADHWTDNISSGAYTSFLTELLDILSVIDSATGKRVWRSDDEIRRLGTPSCTSPKYAPKLNSMGSSRRSSVYSVEGDAVDERKQRSSTFKELMRAGAGAHVEARRLSLVGVEKKPTWHDALVLSVSKRKQTATLRFDADKKVQVTPFDMIRGIRATDAENKRGSGARAATRKADGRSGSKSWILSEDAYGYQPLSKRSGKRIPSSHSLSVLRNAPEPWWQRLYPPGGTWWQRKATEKVAPKPQQINKSVAPQEYRVQSDHSAAVVAFSLADERLHMLEVCVNSKRVIRHHAYELRDIAIGVIDDATLALYAGMASEEPESTCASQRLVKAGDRFEDSGRRILPESLSEAKCTPWCIELPKQCWHYFIRRAFEGYVRKKRTDRSAHWTDARRVLERSRSAQRAREHVKQLTRIHPQGFVGVAIVNQNASHHHFTSVDIVGARKFATTLMNENSVKRGIIRRVCEYASVPGSQMGRKKLRAAKHPQPVSTPTRALPASRRSTSSLRKEPASTRPASARSFRRPPHSSTRPKSALCFRRSPTSFPLPTRRAKSRTQEHENGFPVPDVPKAASFRSIGGSKRRLDKWAASAEAFIRSASQKCTDAQLRCMY